ncbi:LysR family transcriptional regulator [Pseudogracilibacillus sp. SE30717A]|uniref:LysR family transcriptional regulator n=1 Tax=Pseudogracilibacillus sp. SE30717A TaxID=3098293 RepID=UPI00300E4C67
MNIKQLKYFYEIAKEGQITRAAKKLHIAQPPLSQSLKALETRLGVILFERNGREMVLTDAGEVLYRRVEIIFNNLDETYKEVQETGQGIRGTLSIGCNKSCFSHIPNKINIYQEMYPDVNFKLIEGDSYFLTKQLKERELEIAIIRLPIDMSDLEYYELPKEEYVAVVPNNLITVKRESISLQELADIPLFLLHRMKGRGQFEIIMERFEQEGLNVQVKCESPNVDMLLGLVNEGLGATIVPQSTLLKYNTNHVSILKLSNQKIISESAIVWAKDRYLSKSAKRFIELFTNKPVATIK